MTSAAIISPRRVGRVGRPLFDFRVQRVVAAISPTTRDHPRGIRFTRTQLALRFDRIAIILVINQFASRSRGAPRTNDPIPLRGTRDSRGAYRLSSALSSFHPEASRSFRRRLKSEWKWWNLHAASSRSPRFKDLDQKTVRLSVVEEALRREFAKIARSKTLSIERVRTGSKVVGINRECEAVESQA